jgi:hypothetical protein
MTTKALAIVSDGSKPLKNTKQERYARFRAAALPRHVAFRKVYRAANDNVVDANACRLEKKPEVRERIDYLVRQTQDRLVEKRAALEGQLWSVMEADLGDFFETVETARSDRDGKLKTDPDGKMLTARKQRPKLLSDLLPEHRKLIEDVTVDRNGNYVPRLYSRTQANAALCKLLNIGAQTERESSDVTRLSDAELIQQLADLAKELGVDINLNYTFHERGPDAQADGQDSPVIDNDGESDSVQAGGKRETGAECSVAEAADVTAAAELKVAAQPGVAGARPVRAARPKHR